MNAPVWRVEDDGAAQLPASATAEAGLVSLPFLVAAVRRRWRRVVATALLCALLALGLTGLMGRAHTAAATLLLVSDPSTDPAVAMAQDLSFLRTRSVSQQVVTELHLPMTPESFRSTITASEGAPELMTLTVRGASDR